ncbi:SMI1 / KNR4 family protein [compost metagenome]
MRELIDLIKYHSCEVFLNEDGDDLIVELRKGATIEDIARFEIDNGLELPRVLKELLLFSNGINLFGLQILSIQEMEFFPQSKIISFHNWGNGDFDCLSVGGDYTRGAVVFMSHTEDNLEVVSNSLMEWFAGVIAEIKKEGTLLHPLDYNERQTNGMYKKIEHPNNPCIDLSDTQKTDRK